MPCRRHQQGSFRAVQKLDSYFLFEFLHLLARRTLADRVQRRSAAKTTRLNDIPKQFQAFVWHL